ncbi:MAG: DUF6688 family protein [Planctomycetota bacterium]
MPEIEAPAPESQRLEYDHLCWGCQYNLRMQPMDGACPECGLAVAESIRLGGKARRAFTMDFLPWWVRTCYVVFGVVIPLGTFSLAEVSHSTPASGVLFVDWQSGEWYDQAAMLMGGPGAWPFYPLLMFASLCLFLLVINPKVFGRKWVVGIGLILGLVLGLQYACIMLPAMLAANSGNYEMADTFAIGGFLLTAGYLVANGLRMLAAVKWPEGKYPGRFAILEILSAIGAMIVCVVSMILFPLGMWFSPVLYGLAFLSGTTRFLVTRHFDKRDGLDRPSPRGAVWVFITTALAYAAAWPGAVALALWQYHKLPTQPPQGCYVCTAAAKGHPWLVRSVRVRLADGSVMRVSGQMRVLKAAEWVLAERLPWLHRGVRAVYDRVGPRLAARVRSPWSADLAWLVFAGPAAVAWVVLKLLGCGGRIGAAYRGVRE